MQGTQRRLASSLLLAGVVASLATAAPPAASTSGPAFAQGSECTHGGVYQGPGSSFPPAGSPAISAPASSSAPYANDSGSWALWWHFNSAGYLSLKDMLWATESQTGTAEFFLGRGQEQRAPLGHRPTSDELTRNVIPVLLRLLREERDDDIQTAALLALAKIGGGELDHYGPQLEAALVEFLESPSQDVAETAAIALGILGRTNSTFLLANLLSDSPAGRERVGAREVDHRTRSFAAFGLGLIGYASEREDLRRFVVSKLLRAIDTDRTATRDLRTACVIALGMVPLALLEEPPAGPDGVLFPGSSRQGQVAALEALFADDSIDSIVLAHIPVSIARLVADMPTDWSQREVWKGRAIELCARGLDPHAKQRDEIRAGCAIALGMLGDDDSDASDLRTRQLLESELDLGSAQSKRLTLLALGRVAARPGVGPGPRSTEALQSLLVGQLSRATTTVRPWAGLGLALLERGRTERGEVPSAKSLDALRFTLREAMSPEEAGGLAIAVGLAADRESKPILATKISVLRHDDVRGFASISLGLLRATEASDTLRGLTQSSRYRPSLIRDAAVGLGLLGDSQIAPELVSMLRTAKVQSSQAAITSALGFVGDNRALETLLELVQDESLSATARAYGIVALGIIGDKESYPWNYKLSRDLNYAAPTSTLSNAAGTGILDLL